MVVVQSQVQLLLSPFFFPQSAFCLQKRQPVRKKNNFCDNMFKWSQHRKACLHPNPHLHSHPQKNKGILELNGRWVFLCHFGRIIEKTQWGLCYYYFIFLMQRLFLLFWQLYKKKSTLLNSVIFFYLKINGLAQMLIHSKKETQKENSQIFVMLWSWHYYHS